MIKIQKKKFLFNKQKVLEAKLFSFFLHINKGFNKNKIGEIAVDVDVLQVRFLQKANNNNSPLSKKSNRKNPLIIIRFYIKFDFILY